MNKLSIKLFFLAFLSSITFNATAQALPYACDADDLHCAYISGVTEDSNDGRYIKWINRQGNGVVCANSQLAFAVDISMVKSYMGDNINSFLICKDKAGTDCQLIYTDEYNITENNGQYKATPPLFNIDLSKFKDAYPKCNAD